MVGFGMVIKFASALFLTSHNATLLPQGRMSLPYSFVENGTQKGVSFFAKTFDFFDQSDKSLED